MSNNTGNTHENSSWHDPHSETPQTISTAQRAYEEDVNLLWGNQKSALPKEPNSNEIQAEQGLSQSERLSENLNPLDNANVVCDFQKPEVFQNLAEYQNWPWGCIVTIPLPADLLALPPAQQRSAINPLGAELENSALQHAFGLNSATVAIALNLRQGRSGTGVLGLNPDETAIWVNYCRKDAQWYIELAQHWEHRQYRSKEEKDRQKERLGELYINQKQEAIDEWNEFYSSIAAQFTSSEQQKALEDFVFQLNDEPLAEGLTPDQAHQNWSIAKGIDLETQIGGKLSTQATEGIFLDSLFWAYRQVQEIRYFRRSLTSDERDRLKLLFLDQPDPPDDSPQQLTPAVRGEIDQWAGIEYKTLTGQEQANSAGTLWQTLQYAALMQKYPDIWNQVLPDIIAQQIQSRATVEHQGEDVSIQSSSLQQDIIISNTELDELQRELVSAAIARLQANKVRLNSQARSYNQDLSVNSRPWIELRSLSQQDQRLVQRCIQLEDQIESLAKEKAEIYLLLKDSNAERLAEVKMPDLTSQKRVEEIQVQSKEINVQIKLIEKTRIAMMCQFPALGIIDTAKVTLAANTPQTNEDISETLSKGFSDVRYRIDDLQGQIAQEPRQAMRLRDVKIATLNKLKIEPTQEAENPIWQVVLDCWASEASQDNNPELNEPFGWNETIGKSALTVGEMIETVLAPTAIAPLQETTALGMGNANIPLGSAIDSTIVAATLTNQTESSATLVVSETVRVNLVLGYGNILLAGLDAGLSSVEIEALGRLPILQGFAGSLSATEMTLLMRGLKAGLEGQMTVGLAAIRPLQKKLSDVYQDLTWLIRQAGKGGDMVYDAEGRGFQRSHPMEFILDRLGLLQDRLGVGKILAWISDSDCLDL